MRVAAVIIQSSWMTMILVSKPMVSWSGIPSSETHDTVDGCEILHLLMASPNKKSHYLQCFIVTRLPIVKKWYQLVHFANPPGMDVSAVAYRRIPLSFPSLLPRDQVFRRYFMAAFSLAGVVCKGVLEKVRVFFWIDVSETWIKMDVMNNDWCFFCLVNDSWLMSDVSTLVGPID